MIEQPNPLALRRQCELLGPSRAALYYRRSGSAAWGNPDHGLSVAGGAIGARDSMGCAPSRVWAARGGLPRPRSRR
jgi:hypothetical protein